MIFLLLTVVKVREMIVEAIPRSIKLAAAVGIGLFIAFIGMQKAGIVVDHPATLVTIGDFRDRSTLAALAGVIVTAGLLARRVGASVLIGIVVTATLLIVLDVTQAPEKIVEAPTLGTVAFRLDIVGALQWKYLGLVLVFLFFDLFDTLGTLLGVGEQAGFVKDGKLPRMNRALFSDAAASVSAALLGTSTVTSYIESSTGVTAGARTGLANVVTAVCFLLVIPFSPLAEALGGTPAITAPALIVVGCLMMTAVRKIPWDDFTEAFPAFITIVAMPFTYRISEGLALGFIAYPLVKLFAGRRREVHPLVWLLAVVLMLRYVFLATG